MSETQEAAKGALFAVCEFRDKVTAQFALCHEDVDPNNEPAQRHLRTFFTCVFDEIEALQQTLFHDVFGLTEQDLRNMEAQTPNVVKLVAKRKEDGPVD